MSRSLRKLLEHVNRSERYSFESVCKSINEAVHKAKMTFRNLPLTPDQDAEIRRYIERCERLGESWDTLALDYMLNEMLKENETLAVGRRVPRVLALLAVEKLAIEEQEAGRTVPSTHLRALAEAAGLEPISLLEQLEDDAHRIKNELIEQARTSDEG